MLELVQIFLLFNFQKDRFWWYLINFAVMIKEFRNFFKECFKYSFFDVILAPILILVLYIENHYIYWYCYLILWACGLWNLNLILFTFFRFACDFDGYDFDIETLGLNGDFDELKKLVERFDKEEEEEKLKQFNVK